jgi:hypothetical protein
MAAAPGKGVGHPIQIGQDGRQDREDRACKRETEQKNSKHRHHVRLQISREPAAATRKCDARSIRIGSIRHISSMFSVA